MTKYIEKRKKCIPLNEFKKDFNEKLQSDEEHLKQYISVFDLNPIVNYLVFQRIKEYEKYLYKYKFTLNYEDAKKLGCFVDVNEKDLIDSINYQIKKLTNKDNKISNIQSLSKAKLMDFLFYLLLLIPLIEDYEEIMKHINSLRLKIDLIFKSPIYLGNYEIQYYFYYNLFLEFFYYNINEEQNKIESKSPYKSSKIDYFPSIVNDSCSFADVNLTDFMKRKEELNNYIKANKNISETQNEEEKNKTLELDEDLELKKEAKKLFDEKKNKEKNEKIKQNAYCVFIDKLEYLKKYKDMIINTFCEIHTEKEIIDKIMYLYYLLLLELGKKDPPKLELINAFYMQNTKEEIEEMKIYDMKLKALPQVDYNKILYKNIKPGKFFANIGDPFSSNYLAYTFPDCIHKSYIEYDKEIYIEFLEFLRFVYKSPLMQDIFYLCSEFMEFEYPFINDNILNEMFENTNYIPCESKILHGYTQKNLVSIFIPTIIENPDDICLELLIIKLGFLLNTTIHEQSKHYLKALIFYNSFRYGINYHIESDEDLENDENNYLKKLISKRGKKNKNLKGKDGGERTEIFLYGEILERLTCLQGLKMFYKSTWNTSIDKHLSDFKSNYSKEMYNKALKSSVQCLALKEICKDDNKDVCSFFKKIIQKFLEHKQIEQKNLLINLTYSSKKQSDSSNNEIDSQIDINYEKIYKRSNFKDYNP